MDNPLPPLPHRPTSYLVAPCSFGLACKPIYLLHHSDHRHVVCRAHLNASSLDFSHDFYRSSQQTKSSKPSLRNMSRTSSAIISSFASSSIFFDKRNPLLYYKAPFRDKCKYFESPRNYMIISVSIFTKDFYRLL
jgi:hypothetical protein